MKIPAVIIASGIALAAYSLTASSSAGLQNGWTLGGEAPKLYAAGADPADSPSGTASTVLRRTETSHPYGSAQLYEKMPVEPYAGKRVRLRMHVRFQGVDPMQGKILVVTEHGTHEYALDFGSDWTWYQCYLTLPVGTRTLSVGVSLKGPGVAKVDEVQLQTAGDAPPGLNAVNVEQGTLLGARLPENPS